MLICGAGYECSTGGVVVNTRVVATPRVELRDELSVRAGWHAIISADTGVQCRTSPSNGTVMVMPCWLKTGLREQYEPGSLGMET